MKGGRGDVAFCRLVDYYESWKGEESMWSIEDVSAEQLAKLLHHYRGALAHDFAAQGSEEAASSWDRAPQNERKLMVAAARLALLELATAPAQPDSGRKYFAKPGEADWGC
jgi:GH18 family chitinase